MAAELSHGALGRVTHEPAGFYSTFRGHFRVSLEIQLLEELPLPLSQLPVQIPGAPGPWSLLSAAENLDQVSLGRMWGYSTGVSSITFSELFPAALALALLRLLFQKSWNPRLV